VLVAAIEAQESVRPSATNGAVLADWRKALIDCLSEPGKTMDRKIRQYVISPNHRWVAIEVPM
jgi:hypothetical protein